MNFPDLGHLRQLQKDLWIWPRSRAVVMVGAGLSLNAEPLPGVAERFSTWRELARAMFDELYPAPVGASAAELAARELKFERAQPLRLASEYEVAFDRRKLETLIRERNPDSDHEPGLLHTLLLELPWADVFTTNYDTLLERTGVRGRAYQPVTKADDLTTAAAPRIVKLHGSFPSQTPFIISEEDYRTYPRRFAPFVNSVQQALLENAVVLLGFSGDDPNFYEWTGWIRDELGDNHAPFYLVGPLSLGHAQRSLFARRGVTPIDLSPVFAGYTPPNGIHAAAIEWFLRSLAAARPPRPERWPTVEQPASLSMAGCPPVLADVPAASPPIEIAPHGPIDVAQAQAVVKRWHLERSKYPGWLIANDEKRTSLWTATKYWIEPLATLARDWSPADRLRLFREINWRLEVALIPLFTSWIEHFGRALDDSFESMIAGTPPRETLLVIKPDEDIRDVWLELSFALLREARETYNADRWQTLKARMDRLLPQRPQHLDRANYEAALWAMWNADRPAAKAITDGWQPSPHHPITAMWKAGLLAEMDEVAEARTNLRAALTEIRKAVRHHGKDIGLLSLEGWCTYVLFAVESTLDFSQREALRTEFWDRWHELKAWDCSPWPLKEYFDEVLSGPPPELKKERQEVRGFDPGDVTTSLHWEGDRVSPFLPAFACIRLYEVAGIPMRLGNLDITGDALKNACRWIAPFIAFWSPALLIRAGKVNSLRKDDFLARTGVAAMEPQLARRLYPWLLLIFERELAALTDRIAMDSWQEALLEALPVVLSRLAFKAEAKDLKRTFPLVFAYHGKAAVRAHIRLHDSSKPWFRRLFDAADSELLVEWLPQLIRAPLFDEGTHGLIPPGEVWPDPMRHFPVERSREAIGTPPETSALINQATDWLLRRAESEAGEARQRALLRLTDVHGAKLMSEAQRQQLGGLLWSDVGSNGLPNLQNYAVFGFLHLPAPTGIDVSAVVKNYILSLEADGFVVRQEHARPSISIHRVLQPLIYEASLASRPIVQLRGEALGAVDWSPEESRHLYLKAREWWDQDKDAFAIAAEGAPFGTMGADPVLNTLNRLGNYLSRAVLPHMEWASDDDWAEVEKWIYEMRSFAASLSVALPYLLPRRPDRATSVAATLFDDLDSQSADVCASAATAVRHWLHLAAAEVVVDPPSELLMKLIERVSFRREAGVRRCLSQLAYIVLDLRKFLSVDQVSLLIGSLMPWHDCTVLPLADSDAHGFREEERPELRVAVARLAGALQIWWDSQGGGAPEPKALKFWRDACAADPLPEIRRAFDTWNSLQLSPQG